MEYPRTPTHPKGVYFKSDQGANFINILHARFFVQKCFTQLFSSYILATKSTFLQKKHAQKTLMKLTKK
jgi:hypothetical protein